MAVDVRGLNEHNADSRLIDYAEGYRGVPWAYSVRLGDENGEWMEWKEVEGMDKAVAAGEQAVRDGMEFKDGSFAVDWAVFNHRGEMITSQVLERNGGLRDGWGPDFGGDEE